jgi:hypothetical protein
VKRPRGPELKLPAPKPPGFLVDLYHDLRDRRLLPLIALVLVAIVSTPILLSQSPEQASVPAGAGPIAALREGGGPKGSTLTVVQAEPGLRKYQLRLRGRKPTDPFRKPKPKGSSGGGKSGQGSGAPPITPITSTSTTVSETSHSTTTSETTTTKTAGKGTSVGELGGKHPRATLFSFAAELTIVHSSGSKAEGNKTSDPPETRKKVMPTTVLPSEKTQVVTYMGIAPKTRNPYFLVSPDVTGVFGEGKCISGAGSCQLIELEPGFPEIFEYGEGGDRYSIKVSKVEFIVAGHV